MNEPPIDRPAKGPPPVTDSPWYWLALFGVMGLAALLAIGPKYGRRQASIERKHQAQQQMPRLGGGMPVAGMPVAGETGPPSDVEYSNADSTIVSLWPIRLVVLLVTVVSAAVLAGQRIAQHRTYASSARDDR